jgi:hypothetical protein
MGSHGKTKVRKAVEPKAVEPSDDATPVETKAVPRKGIVRRAIEEFPSLSAQIASLPVVVACMAAFGGLSVFRWLGTSIASGDPMGGIALAGASIYALLVTAAIAQMKEGLRP